jgi:hypothetical protein
VETTLSQWQDPETGYPTDTYRDAVIVALEAIGIGVHDSWRDEPHDFVIELHRNAFTGRISAHDLLVGWRIDEETEPLTETPEEWHGVGQVCAGWHWVPTGNNGVGKCAHDLDHPEVPGSPMHPLEEPEVVAAAVAAMIENGHN